MSKVTLTSAVLDFDGKNKLSVRDYKKIPVGILEFKDAELRDKYSENIKSKMNEEIEVINSSTNDKITIKDEFEKQESEELEEKNEEKDIMSQADDMII